MSLTLSSTTDPKDVIDSAAQGDDARVPQPKYELEQLDGSSSVSYEHPASERSLLLARLKLAEKEANELIGPEDEGETVDAVGEPGAVELNDAAKADAKEAPEPQTARLAQESNQLVGQSSAAPVFLMRIGQIAQENPEGVQALAASKVSIPKPVLDVLATEPAGADLAVWLAMNPEAAEQLQKMPVQQAVQTIIENLGVLKFQAQQAASGQQEPTAPRRAVSQAPAPIKPLGGGGHKSSVPLDNLSYQEYRKIRDQQAKARYSR